MSLPLSYVEGVGRNRSSWVEIQKPEVGKFEKIVSFQNLCLLVPQFMWKMECLFLSLRLYWSPWREKSILSPWKSHWREWRTVKLTFLELSGVTRPVAVGSRAFPLRARARGCRFLSAGLRRHRTAESSPTSCAPSIPTPSFLGGEEGVRNKIREIRVFKEMLLVMGPRVDGLSVPSCTV